jgi:hypothetical protein
LGLVMLTAPLCRRSCFAALPIAGVLCAGAAARGLAPDAQNAPNEEALLKRLGFSAQELQKINRGEVVGRTTDADASAVALVVAGTIAVPVAFYLEKFRTIESFKKSPEIHQIGRFGEVPSVEDVAGLTLDPADVNDLKGCRVNACGVKLDADGIGRLARRDAQPADASAAMRHYLAGYAQRYLRAGNGALIEYRDSSSPRRLADELRVILERSDYLERGWPSLYKAVAHFSGSLPEGLEHFLYWSKEKIGPRPVLSVTHVIISPPQGGTAAIASKQLFASHYSTGSLGLTILVDKSVPGVPRTLVVYVNRSRLDIFGGLLGSIKRPLVRSRARDGAERTMRLLRDRMERQYGAPR